MFVLPAGYLERVVRFTGCVEMVGMSAGLLYRADKIYMNVLMTGIVKTDDLLARNLYTG